jgi:hypothetical protein
VHVLIVSEGQIDLGRWLGAAVFRSSGFQHLVLAATYVLCISFLGVSASCGAFTNIDQSLNGRDGQTTMSAEDIEFIDQTQIAHWPRSPARRLKRKFLPKQKVMREPEKLQYAEWKSL